MSISLFDVVSHKLMTISTRYDFWKGLLIADIFIYVVYMIMGLVIYSNQGQYSFNPAYQGETEC